MTTRLTLLAFILFHAFAPIARGDEAAVLANLRKGHPRLLVLDSDLVAVKQAIASDPLAKTWHDQLVREAEKLLDAKPIEHVLIGPRLLDKSRTCLNRVSTLAGLYRLDGDRRFAQRAIQEMLTAAAFEDWNPKHFLDTAEMTAALGIGYDWLFDVLSPQEQQTIHQAIVKLGLEEGLKVYQGDRWWAKAIHNWNQVCNGGLTIGALAIADEDPVLSARVIQYAKDSIPRAMASFGPDGGWAEGPGYWGYTTHYTCFYLAALQTALGTDFGLKQTPGYADTGYFRMHSISPIDRTFNYADAGDRGGTSFPMMWMARALDRPLYAAHERSRTDRGSIFHLLFWDGRATWPQAGQPTAAVYRGVDVAIFRSSWTDPNAFWVGFKGGDNRANHSHLDLGTFNFDALGQRWALDLGGDEYNLPGYFGKQRWSYYRLRTEGHNTLTIDDDNQDPAAKSPLIAFHTDPAKTYAVADVTAAYGKKLAKWQRGIALLDGRQVAIIDEVVAKSPVTVTWNFHTAAKVQIAAEGRSATLRNGKAQIQLVIASPSEGKFKIVSANPPEPQKQNPGVSNLVIELPGVTSTTIQVLASADGSAGEPLGPLEQWVASGKIEK